MPFDSGFGDGFGTGFAREGEAPPPTATVPDVVGDDQATAVSAIEGAGFEVALQFAFSDSVEIGDVISQDPAASTEQELGSVVTIVVSLGEAPSVTTSVRRFGMGFN